MEEIKKMGTKLKTRLGLAIIVIFSSSERIIANGTDQQNPEKFHQQALDQTDEIDLIFELLTEAANKDKLSARHKKDSLAKLGNMRTMINLAKENDNLPQIIGTNEVMINSLMSMTNNNFNTIPNITNTQILRRATRLSTIDTQEKLKFNTQKLQAIQKSFKNVGLSKLNVMARKLEKLIKKFKIPRLAPYCLIVLYMMFVTRKEEIGKITGKLPGILARPIDAVKDIMGTAPFIKQENSTAPEVKDRDQGEAGSLNALQSLLQTGGFLQIEIEPILKWAPATLLLGFIKKDWDDLTKALKKKINYIFSKLKNDIVDEDTLFDEPSFNSDSLDLSQISEFKNLKNYFKYKSLFNLADHSVAQFYLLSGPLETSAITANVLCAQMAQELDKDCRIVQLNASEFVQDKPGDSTTIDTLETVLSDSKKHDISFIIIDHMDWIYNQKAGTVAALNKFLNAASKKSKVVVIGLTDQPKDIIFNTKNIPITVDIENPNYEQRINFIKAQLKSKHAEQLDIETIAQQTENYTLGELKRLVDNAYTISYAEHKPLNKIHLALSAENMAKKRR